MEKQKIEEILKELTCYEKMELLAILSSRKGVNYETELKDAKPFKLKNIRIDEIVL